MLCIVQDRGKSIKAMNSEKRRLQKKKSVFGKGAETQRFVCLCPADLFFRGSHRKCLCAAACARVCVCVYKKDKKK